MNRETKMSKCGSGSKRGYENNKAWQAGVRVVTAVYRMTRELPDSERFGLVSQLRRTAVSVPSNIAEGNTAGSDGLYLRHVRIARGSVGELETQLRIVDNLGLLEHGVPDELWNDVGHMARLTNGLWRYLRDKTPRH